MDATDTPLRIAFDLGGVLMKHPQVLGGMMHALAAGGAEVHVLTDMPPHVALPMVEANGLPVPPERVHCVDFSAHGDMCKTLRATEVGFDVVVDDRPDYVAVGDFVGLVVSPRPRLPYQSSLWITPPPITEVPKPSRPRKKRTRRRLVLVSE